MLQSPEDELNVDKCNSKHLILAEAIRQERLSAE